MKRQGPDANQLERWSWATGLLDGQASVHCRFLSCGRLPLMSPSTRQPMRTPYRIVHVDGGLPACCHSCVCWCRWWHRGAGCRALTGKAHYSAHYVRVRVHVCVCLDRQAERQAVCTVWAFDTLVSVAVLARSRIIFHPSQCAALVDVYCATAGSRDRVAYSTQWIAINFNLRGNDSTLLDWNLSSPVVD